MKYPQDIVIEEITENKEAFIELLLIADPSVDMITKYLSKGHLFTMQVKKEVVCAVVVVSDGVTAEIKNLVTHPDHLRKGYASHMISFIINYFQGTPLDLTIRCHIIRNFFVDNYPEPIFEDNGEQCIDMVYLKYLPDKKD